MIISVTVTMKKQIPELAEEPPAQPIVEKVVCSLVGIQLCNHFVLASKICVDRRINFSSLLIPFGKTVFSDISLSSEMMILRLKTTMMLSRTRLPG